MYIYIYICIYVYANLSLSIYTYIYIHIYIHIDTHVIDRHPGGPGAPAPARDEARRRHLLLGGVHTHKVQLILKL